MSLRRESCREWRLYVIANIDPHDKRPVIPRVRGAILGGADVIQLRDKVSTDQEMISLSREILTLTRKFCVPLIINDRIQVAKTVNADGVHLGQEDGSLGAARQLLGDDKIIGRSTHSLKQAREAQREGADYIGVGPVFSTPTKSDYEPVGLGLVSEVSRVLTIPFVAIGGIDALQVRKVVTAGGKAVAVVRAVWNAQDPEKEAAKIKRQLMGEKQVHESKAS